MKKKYFDVHVFYSRKDGFSVFIETFKTGDNEEEIIEEAVNQGYITLGDAQNVDYVQEITADEYKEFKGVIMRIKTKLYYCPILKTVDRYKCDCIKTCTFRNKKRCNKVYKLVEVKNEN